MDFGTTHYADRRSPKRLFSSVSTDSAYPVTQPPSSARHRGVNACGLVAACVLLFVGPRVATADTVQLLNGDRISGQVVSLANGTLAFQTPNGQLNVPWTAVTGLVVAEPIFVTVGTRPPTPATVAATRTDGRVTLRPGGIVSLIDITAMARVSPPLGFTGRINAGMVATDGNSEVNTLRLDGELVGRTPDHRYTGRATINRAQDREVETANNVTTLFRYDRFLTRRLFLNGNTILTNDQIRLLDLRVALGGGVGMQVIETPRMKISMDAGLGYVNETYTSEAIQNDERYTAVQESAKLDIYVSGTRFVLFHRHDGYFSLAGNDNRFIKMGNGVRVPIAGGFIATLQLDLDYDPTPIPGGQSIDRTFALSFGYQFQ
jgi:putative salt-induced outer membrane protein YdiY